MAASPSEERPTGTVAAKSGELVHRVPVRWSDLDLLGHVNQSVYHQYLEEARVALLRRAGDPSRFVLARVELDHLCEIGLTVRYVDVAARVVDVGRSSVRIEHEIRLPSGTVSARGVSIEVGWNPGQRAKRDLDEEERQRLRGAA